MSKRTALVVVVSLTVMMVAWIPLWAVSATGWKVIAWNNLGMHCMDADFSVFAILPPYNTIQAEVIDPNGKKVKDPARVQLTYQAVADPAGSINKTSQGKTNFWNWIQPLFGVPLAVDRGLAGKDMPGPSNAPQTMSFDSNVKTFVAEGIPIAPFDDRGQKNTYPMMQVTAQSSSGAPLASARVVLPVSDEMDCSACHASGTQAAAKPSAGWVWVNDSQRDFRLNILRLHDDLNAGKPLYAQSLAAAGYDPKGLFETVNQRHVAILCARCHTSEALPGSGQPGVPPLTRAVHARHAPVIDPLTGQTLDATSNRSACYRCHPGSETRCLRGAMGNATAPDGTMLMQCQSCHGSMAAVGAPTRTGWLNEPSCGQCHTGTATKNSGQIRYTSVFLASGSPRQAADRTFETNSNTPGPGFSLYRFSKGHGGLQCSACHGSTHAEFPSSHANDNLLSIDHQGHAGVLVECASCHGSKVPETVAGGPHGLHPIGAKWVDKHGDAAEHDPAPCQSCHGANYRGTVLSEAQADRSFRVEGKTRKFTRGQAIGCYDCHDGPRGD